MTPIISSDFKLGIIAGGQLGKMLVQTATKLNITTYVMDSSKDSPAAGNCNKFFTGDYTKYEDVYQFGKQVDFLTFEIEHINIDALKALQKEGLKMAPDPSILAVVQDKSLQKQFYKDHDIPTAPFQLFATKPKLLKAIEEKTVQFPFVHKLKKGGYDGRAVTMVNKAADLDLIPKGACLVEDKVIILKEVAVVISRNEKGEIEYYPPFEMIFNPKANLVEYILSPAALTETEEAATIEVAKQTISAFQGTGVMAIEMFIDIFGRVLVNECAPRPHNSGHLTIEAAMTSQFEQHLRGVLNLPLGSRKMISPAVMINLLGEPEKFGPVVYEGIEKVFAIKGASFHFYGKKETKPFRKMGHVTILSTTIEQARRKADYIKQHLKVTTDE